MMDTRMDRVFSLETSQWISPRQLRAFEGQLDSWSKDGSVQEIIVIFGSPLLYLDGSLAELAVWWEVWSLFRDFQAVEPSLLKT
jgi:hypothetical protein